MNDIVSNACHVFLNGKLSEQRLGRKTWQPPDTSIYQSAVLATGTSAMDVLRRAFVPLSEADSLDLEYNRLTWEEYVRAGVHPVRAREAGLPIIVRLSAQADNDPNELMGHPLNLAVMFAKFLDDHQSAAECVRAYSQIAQTLKMGVPLSDSPDRPNPWEQASVYRYNERHSQFGFWTHSWICPDPREYGLEDLLVSDSGGTFMSYALFSWYAEEAALTKVSGSHWGGSDALERLVKALHVSGVSYAAKILEQAALTCIKNRWDDTQPQYERLAMFIRAMTRADASARIASATGAKATLGICRKDSTKDQMTAGLSALAQRGDWIKHLSSLYGRSPSVSELCGLRAKRLVDVLYYMPMSMLKEVLEEDQAVERLRARLLREVQTADPTMLRGVLSDHDKRAKLAPYPLLTEPHGDLVGNTGTKDTEWDVVFCEMAARYQMAVAFRSKISELMPDELIRVTAVLSAKEPNHPIVKILSTDPSWEEVSALIKGFSRLFQMT